MMSEPSRDSKHYSLVGASDRLLVSYGVGRGISTHGHCAMLARYYPICLMEAEALRRSGFPMVRWPIFPHMA